MFSHLLQRLPRWCIETAQDKAEVGADPDVGGDAPATQRSVSRV